MHSNKNYKLIEHTADVGIKVTGESITEIFEKAILATSDLVSDGIEIEPKVEKKFNIEEEDIKTAIVSVLEEILYIFEKDFFLPSECTVKVEKNSYKCTLKGNIISSEEIKDGTDIKAVTYHQLEIKEIEGEYQAKVIFDV